MFVFNRGFRYVRIYIYVPYVNLYAHARWYVMWEELSVDHFLKHSNHLKRTLKCFKMDLCASLPFNIQSSDYGATNVAKVSLYSTFTRSTLSFGYV